MIGHEQARRRTFATGTIHYSETQRASVAFALDDAGKVMAVTETGYIRLSFTASSEADAIRKLSQDGVTSLRAIDRNGTKTGLSLSFCVRDLALGRVAYADVKVIITRTALETWQDYLGALRSYTELYWRRECDTEKACAIARRLWKEGKIYQPKLHKQPLVSYRTGEHWTTADLDAYLK